MTMTRMMAIAALMFLSVVSALAAEQTLSVGKSVKIGSVEVVLNKVVLASKDELGGAGYTEYNLTLTNGSPDKEVVLSNVALSVHGETRSMVKNPDDIVNQGNTSEKAVATTAGATAAGFLGGLLGPLGAMGSQIGVQAAANKIYVDDPQKWRDEIKKQGFQRDDAGISVFPSESATGSIWVKQSGNETANRMQLYLKQGGISRLVKLGLKAGNQQEAEK
ncbi:MAG: hypothetical protein PHP70_06600 [Gallionella sp.]|nr:hypothetical protein [Gallionella sp.]